MIEPFPNTQQGEYITQDSSLFIFADFFRGEVGWSWKWKGRRKEQQKITCTSTSSDFTEFTSIEKRERSTPLGRRVASAKRIAADIVPNMIAKSF